MAPASNNDSVIVVVANHYQTLQCGFNFQNLIASVALNSQTCPKICVINPLARAAVLCLGRRARVDGFNCGRGHIKYLSNCLQHAVSTTDSLLINVENCLLSSANAGQRGSIYFQLFFSSAHSNVSLIVLLLFSSPAPQMDFPIL